MRKIKEFCLGAQVCVLLCLFMFYCLCCIQQERVWVCVFVWEYVFVLVSVCGCVFPCVCLCVVVRVCERERELFVLINAGWHALMLSVIRPIPRAIPQIRVDISATVPKILRLFRISKCWQQRLSSKMLKSLGGSKPRIFWAAAAAYQRANFWNYHR